MGAVQSLDGELILNENGSCGSVDVGSRRILYSAKESSRGVNPREGETVLELDVEGGRKPSNSLCPGFGSEEVHRCR